jgi:hypothetical protein
MGELTTDSTPGWWTPAAAPTAESIAHDPRHYAIGCPECFDELQRNRDWWKARLEGRDLSGSSSRVTTYPSVVEQRNDLARFGVGILDFEHPRSWGLGDVGAAVRQVDRDVAGGRRARGRE